jgi:hypothetical protein
MDAEATRRETYLGRIYLERPPTLDELARDMRELATQGGWPGDSDSTRKSYAKYTRRLARAARSERLGHRGTLAIALYGALGGALALAACYVLIPAARGDTQGDLSGFVVLALVGGAVGAATGLLYRDWLRPDFEWATAYRESLMASQQRLLSEEGDEGWRLVKQRDGTWHYQRIGSDQSPTEDSAPDGA